MISLFAKTSDTEKGFYLLAKSIIEESNKITPIYNHYKPVVAAAYRVRCNDVVIEVSRNGFFFVSSKGWDGRDYKYKARALFRIIKDKHKAMITEQEESILCELRDIYGK